ncbi:G-protein coupled receptor [Biomphalaria pfeifferi]|uniref:G-protein coupled receptor n=1 Tax=Biomphalaria pfeifferi TaxID=112525 RepID=A0AAD8F0M2_BIOPF|nr:G-protein coupled receptor [Biomphalaria pfeifferi]
MYQDISNDVTEIEVFICYVIVSPIITIAGFVTNVINIVVYSKHGVRESINVTFLTLAITNLAGLVFSIWYGIGLNPLLSSRTDLSFDSMEVTYLTGASKRLLFPSSSQAFAVSFELPGVCCFLRAPRRLLFPCFLRTPRRLLFPCFLRAPRSLLFPCFLQAPRRLLFLAAPRRLLFPSSSQASAVSLCLSSSQASAVSFFPSSSQASAVSFFPSSF